MADADPQGRAAAAQHDVVGLVHFLVSRGEQVVALAHRAGEAILEVYAGDFDVTLKGDDSPLTVADLRSHRIIAAGLATLELIAAPGFFDAA